MSNSIFNPELLKLAHDQVSRVKSGFVDAATAQAGGAPPTGAAGGPMPPTGAPGGAMPPTGAAGGAMPPTGAAGGAPMPGGGDPLAALQPMIQQAVSEAMATQGGGKGEGEKKMKVDVNQEIYQIKKILVMMAEEMNLPVPATMLLGDPAQDPNSPPGQAESDPMSAGYDPATAQQSAIPPIEPMGAAAPGMGQEEGQKAATAQDERIHRGVAFDVPATSNITRNTNTARALLAQLNAR